MMVGTEKIAADKNQPVFLVAEPEGVAMGLLELTLSQLRRVQIISENVNLWQAILPRLRINQTVAVVGFGETLILPEKSVIYLVDPIFYRRSEAGDGEVWLKLLTQLKSQPTFFNTSLVFILHTSRAGSEMLGKIKRLLGEIKTVKYFYTANLFGPRMSLQGGDLLSQLFLELYQHHTLTLPGEKSSIRPLFIGDFLREIIYPLENTPERVEFFGEKKSLLEWGVALLKAKPGSSLSLSDRPYFLPEVPEAFRILVKSDIPNWLTRTLAWLEANNSSNQSNVKEKILVKPQPEVKVKKAKQLIKISKLHQIPKTVLKPLAMLIKKATSHPKIKTALGVILVLLLLFTTPILAMLLSLGTLVLAQKQQLNNAPKLAAKLFAVSYHSAGLANLVFDQYSSLPVIGTGFQRYHYYASDLVKITQIGRVVADVATQSLILSNGVWGERDYPLTTILKKLLVDLDLVYRQTSFLEGEVASQGISRDPYLKTIFDRFNLSQVRKELYQVRGLINRVPLLLGMEGEKNYLVLFQNNMELRPTGGFIGSFGLVKLKAGRMADFKVYDVYDADGQLKGHVEPPPPIKKYLGEANWYLRDSNWDPDFAVSAQRAEWFLAKEMDMTVDGVVSFDLEVVKNLLGYLGPLQLADYNQTVDSRNLYEVTQYEVEKDFFAGSKKKAGFLTALAKEIMLTLSSAGSRKLLGASMVFYQGLSQRHIQLYFKDQEALRAVSDLNWSGEVVSQTCASGNCYHDFFGVVEANLGVNKANYWVKRAIAFDGNLNGTVLKRSITVSVSNQAPMALGDRGVYKTYLRIIAPADGVTESVKLIKGETVQNLPFDQEFIKNRLETGVWVSVNPSATIKVAFTLRSNLPLDFEAPGSYSLWVRKQAGTVEDPFYLNLYFPNNLKVKTLPNLSLTGSGTLRYNQNLLKDLKLSVYW